jgi:putative ABC transport system permease protein
MIGKLMRAIWSIAWRDLRASASKTIYIVAAIALSAASISGVRSAESSAREALENSSREWLAADVAVHIKDPMTAEQQEVLDQLHATGVEWTVATSTLSMASSDQSPDPGFIGVKAVDPREYPFYGSIDLAPARPLSSVLTPETVVVSSEVPSRLQVKTGDTIRVAGYPFRIAAVIVQEPDRFAGTPSMGMRCILAQDGYNRTGIARGGSTELFRILLRVPRAAGLDTIDQRLESVFPDGTVVDAHAGNRQVASTVELAISALGPPSVKAFVLGVLGVMLAIRQYVEQRLATIALMKSLGGRSWQIAATFLIQIAVIAAIAFFISIPLGYGTQALILSTAAKFVAFKEPFAWHWNPVFESALATLIAVIPALVQPAWIVRRARPAVILRRGTAEAEVARTLHSPVAVPCTLACVGLAAASAYVQRSWLAALVVLALTVASFAGIAGVAAALLHALRRLTPTLKSPALRHGLANLYRSGNSPVILIVALAIGVTTMLSTVRADGAIARSLATSPSLDGNNFFIVDFDRSYRAKILDLLSHQPGVDVPVHTLGVANLTLASIDGKPVSRASTSIPRHWLVTCSAGAVTTIADDTARMLAVEPGSTIEMLGRGLSVFMKVAVVRRFSPIEKVWSSITLDCDALGGQNVYEFIAAHVAPDELKHVTTTVHAAYPALAVITGPDLVSTAIAVSDDSISVLLSLGWYTVGGGITVLIATIASSRAGRRQQVGTLMALGAGARRLIAIYCAEFAAIGILAGFIGSAFAWLLTSVTLFGVFRHWTFDAGWRDAAVSTLICAAATPAIACLQDRRLFSMRPIDVLRRE